MSGRKLFGTDGIRGRAGEPPLDRPTVERVGLALATVLARSSARPRVLLGRDTRESGAMIEQWLTRGLLSVGSRVTSGGVLSTPAIAYLTRDGAYDAGVVVSASHNPFFDNGIKVFSGTGFKLPDAVELQVEDLALGDRLPGPILDQPVQVYGNGSDPLLRTRYTTHLTSVLPAGFSFEGRRVVLDCANGAATPLAPEVFRKLGADVTAIGCEPTGRNINDGSGSLHPERLAEAVLAARAFLGAAYDGDADRCLLVDETGAVRDGDDILAVAATQMKQAGTLGPGGVILTVMANLGLELYLEAQGIVTMRAPVGDKYVLEEMTGRGSTLGGEQSGHVIFLDNATTGDGILTSLCIAHAVMTSGRTLSELASCWTRLPQVLRNVKVRERVDLADLPHVARALEEVRGRIEGRGRMLVRYSGTEPLLRIMLEGPDMAEIEGYAARLADAVAKAIG